jgi:hypothetical protein
VTQRIEPDETHTLAFSLALILDGLDRLAVLQPANRLRLSALLSPTVVWLSAQAENQKRHCPPSRR